jgi:hypothetical protein
VEEAELGFSAVAEDNSGCVWGIKYSCSSVEEDEASGYYWKPT